MKKYLIKFFTGSKNISRASYIWNTMSATLFAIQSALLLIVITRTNGIADAGIFSIAYAIGSLLYYVGEYGVRKYQVSDVHEELSFTEYHSHRVVACTIMLIAAFACVANGMLRNGYSWNKAYIVLMICLVKVVEAYQEVYFGRFQQVGRLDVSSKTNLFRTVLSMFACMIALIVSHDMAISMTVWFLSQVLFFYLSSIIVYPQFAEIRWEFNWKSIWKIFKECLPLAAGYFLLLYVGNAPKYAIDACMSDIDQARYNFIFMPVFAIGLFANFIFNPILVDLSKRWDNNEVNKFKKMVWRQVFVIIGVTLMAIAVALTIGAPILGWLYNSDLRDLKIDLAMLMVGGGMLAMVNFFTVIVTVIRKQKYLMVGYIVGAIAAWLLSERVVGQYGIRGAVLLYVCLMVIMTIAFAVVLIMFVEKHRKELILSGEIRG